MFQHAYPVHPGSPTTRSPMRTRSLRPGVLIAVVAILFTACSGSATPVPSAAPSATPAESTAAPEACTARLAFSMSSGRIAEACATAR